MKTINESVNAALDIEYAKSAAKMLSRIDGLTNSQTTAIQRALRDLDDEAARLNEAGERMTRDNAYLEKVLRLLAVAFVAAATLIDDNSNRIEESGQIIAPVAVTAKIFSQLIKTAGNPVMPDKLAGYIRELDKLGVDWTAPKTLDFARKYTELPAWSARMAKWGEGYSDLISKTVLDGIDAGWGPEFTAGKLRKLVETMPKYAAENLTRTLQLTSYREASLAMESLNGSFIEYKIRLSALDVTSCLSCVALHGERIEKGERLDDHYNGMCDLPGNMISGAIPTAFVSRNYNGDAIVIHTASGKILPVTPNHPILTDRGWVAAQFIKVGDNVISYGGADWTSVNVYPNKKHIPSIIQDIPRTFLMDRLGSMPITSENFHGDGINGDIGVIWANSLLRNKIDTSFVQPNTKKPFGIVSRKTNQFFSSGNIATMIERQFSTASEFLRVLDIGFSDIFRHSFHPQFVGNGNITSFTSGINQPCADHTPGNSERFSNLVLALSSNISGDNGANINKSLIYNGLGETDFLNSRTFGSGSIQSMSLEIITKSLIGRFPYNGRRDDIHPGLVSLDPVVEIGVTGFSGHVYSLQSDREWYIDNGIIAHNCSEFYVVPGGDPYPEFMQIGKSNGSREFVPFQKGEDWFNSLSKERQAQQRSFAQSPAKLRAFQAGHPLSEFVGEHKDDVFGMMPIEKSLVGALGDAGKQYYARNQQE